MKTNRLQSLFLGTVFMSLLIGCGQEQEEKQVNVATQEQEPETQVIEDEPLTKEERDLLSPADVVQEFKQGNVRFMGDSLTPRDRQTRIQQTVMDQFPKAMVISCIDSRVPVEEVFDQGLGDIFVGRIAGNFVDEEMLGSTEYATKVAGSKLVVIMGHEGCGAVKSAIADVQLGNITPLLAHIKPAVEMTDNFPEEERNAENKEFVDAVVKNNVRYNLEQARKNSSILAEMEQEGSIQIVGAYYDLDNGEVVFMDDLEQASNNEE